MQHSFMEELSGKSRHFQDPFFIKIMISQPIPYLGVQLFFMVFEKIFLDRSRDHRQNNVGCRNIYFIYGGKTIFSGVYDKDGL